MNVRLTALVLPLALAFTVTACGNDTARTAPSPAPSPVQTCGPYEVLESDDDGLECEPDENQNGIDDENEGIASEEPAEEVVTEDEGDSLLEKAAKAKKAKASKAAAAKKAGKKKS